MESIVCSFDIVITGITAFFKSSEVQILTPSLHQYVQNKYIPSVNAVLQITSDTKLTLKNRTNILAPLFIKDRLK